MAIGTVSCIYDLPAALAVQGSVFGQRFPTQIGDADAEVLTPELVGAAFGAPALPGVPTDAVELTDGQWANSSAWVSDDSFQLRRIGLVVKSAPDRSPVGRPGAGTSLEERLIDTAFANIDTWFDRLRSWVEVLTGQDLDTQTPRFEAWFEGSGLRAWRREGSHLAVVDRSRVVVTSNDPRPLPSKAWRFVLERSGRGHPPAERLLMRDARAALARSQSRRAVLDAGAAAELILVELVDAALMPLPRATRAAATPRHRTLGTLVGFAKGAEFDLPVSSGELDTIVRLRNAATHGAETPSYDAALEVLNSVQRLVEQARPLVAPSSTARADAEAGGA